jgi:hypothetical protein
MIIPMRLSVILLALLIPIAAIALPPSGERLDQLLRVGLVRDPVKKSANITTTVVSAIDTDITTKVDSAQQLLVVTNLASSANVCVGSVAWSGADSCATRCGTATAWSDQTDPDYTSSMNCTLGSANIGSLVPHGQSRQFRYDGTRCVCMVASTSNTDVLVERVVR